METSGSWTGVHFKKKEKKEKKESKHKPSQQEMVHYRPHAKRGRPPLKNLIENKGYGETTYHHPRSKSPASVATNGMEATSYYKRKKYKAPAPPPNGHIPNGTPFVRQNSFRSVQTFSTTDSALKAKKRRAPPPPPIIPESPAPGNLTRRVSDESLDIETHSVHTISADVHNESGDIEAELDDVVATIERTRKEIDDFQKEDDSGISSNGSAITTSLARRDIPNIARLNKQVESDMDTLDVKPPPSYTVPTPPSPTTAIPSDQAPSETELPSDQLPPKVDPPTDSTSPTTRPLDLSGTTLSTDTLQTNSESMLTDVTVVDDRQDQLEEEKSTVPIAPPIVLPIKPAPTFRNETAEDFAQVKLKKVTSLTKATIPITKFDLFKSELARAAMERSKKGHVEPPPKLPWHLQLQEELSKAVKAREARRKGGTVRMKRLRSQTTIFPAKRSDSDSLPTTPRDKSSQSSTPRESSESQQATDKPNQTMYPAVEKPIEEHVADAQLQDTVFKEIEEAQKEEENTSVVLISQKPLAMDSDTSIQSQSVYLGSEPEEEGWTPQVDLTDDDDDEREMITARGNASIPKSFHIFNESPTIQKKKKAKKGMNIRKSVKSALGTIGRAVHRRKKINEMLDDNWEIYQAEEFDEMPAGIVNVDHIEKRPAYAYHPGKGQLMLLPEYETVIVTKDGKRIQESALREKKQKKDKKFSYQKTERRKEKERLDKELTKAISAREILFDEERAKHLEMERRFLEGRGQKPIAEVLPERNRQQESDIILPPLQVNNFDWMVNQNKVEQATDLNYVHSSYSPTDEGDVDSPLPQESDNRTESETNPVSSRLGDSGFTDNFSLSTAPESQHSPESRTSAPRTLHTNGNINFENGHIPTMVTQNGGQPGMHQYIPNHGPLPQQHVGFIQGSGPYMGYPMNMQNVTMATPTVTMQPIQPMNMYPMMPMPTLITQPNTAYLVNSQPTNASIQHETNPPRPPTTDTNNNRQTETKQVEQQPQSNPPIVPPLDLSSITKDEEDNNKDASQALDGTTSSVPVVPVAPPPPPVSHLTKDTLPNAVPKGFVRPQLETETSDSSSPRSVLDSSVGLPSFYKKPSGYRPVRFNSSNTVSTK